MAGYAGRGAWGVGRNGAVAADVRRTPPTRRWRVLAINLSQGRFRVRSPGFSRPRARPAEAGTPNQLDAARFMGSFLAFAATHRGHEPMLPNDETLSHMRQSLVATGPADLRRFMEGFDLQFLDAHCGHEPDVRSIAELINSAMVARLDRSMGSSHLHSEAHRDHEPAARNIAELANSGIFSRVSRFMERRTHVESAESVRLLTSAATGMGTKSLRFTLHAPRFTGFSAPLSPPVLSSPRFRGRASL